MIITKEDYEKSTDKVPIRRGGDKSDCRQIIGYVNKETLSEHLKNQLTDGQFLAANATFGKSYLEEVKHHLMLVESFKLGRTEKSESVNILSVNMDIDDMQTIASVLDRVGNKE